MEKFSRPQLMGTVRYEDPEYFTRKRGLQKFGHLLNAGKLKRLGVGFFEIADEIGYQIEDLKVG
jgi:hypothetical protein